MSGELKGRTIAILAADGVEQVELEQTRRAVEAAGAETELLSIRTGQIQAMNHDLEPADRFTVAKAVVDAAVEDYDGLILPGGTVNPDKLRQDAWTLVEADLVRGRTLTSYPSIRTDIRNAGGNVVDEEVVVDHGLVTSRSPDDLPAFCAKLVEEFAEGLHDIAPAGATRVIPHEG